MEGELRDQLFVSRRYKKWNENIAWSGNDAMILSSFKKALNQKKWRTEETLKIFDKNYNKPDFQLACPSKYG